VVVWVGVVWFGVVGLLLVDGGGGGGGGGSTVFILWLAARQLQVWRSAQSQCAQSAARAGRPPAHRQLVARLDGVADALHHGLVGAGSLGVGVGWGWFWLVLVEG